MAKAKEDKPRKTKIASATIDVYRNPDGSITIDREHDGEYIALIGGLEVLKQIIITESYED